jgi:hypothetical protein
LGGPSGTALFGHKGRLLAYNTATGVELWDVGANHEIGALTGEDKWLIGFDAQDQNLLVVSSEGLLRWPIQESLGYTMTAGDPILASAQIRDSGCVTPNARIGAFVGEDRWRT